MLNNNDIETLERATLDAVAPPRVETLPDWLLPFDQSTIGRAHSAVPLRHTGLDARMVHTIANRYISQQHQVKFRVADLRDLAPIHQAMHHLGLTPQQPTLVQVGSASEILAALGRNAAGCATARITVTERPTTGWSSVYLSQGFDPTDGAHRVQALSRSSTVVFACLSENHNPVAAGTASFSHGWASMHGLRTTENARGRGFAGQLLASLAQAAVARGLDRVFLQVEESNASALALYHRAGFRTAWRYHYWRDFCMA